MEQLWNPWASLALLAVGALGTGAAEGKEVTLKGKISCAKCELKLPGVKKCQTVIQVQEDGKEATYFFLDKGNKEEYHEAVCGGGKKEGTVSGIVSEKDGKKWIKPTKVEYRGAEEKQAMKGPIWMKDYATALKSSRQEHKPLAIFIGCGKDGWKNVVRGGKLDKGLKDMLSKEVVCVYVDAETQEGKRLASTLKVSDGTGLVLGDRNGEYIDHRHSGAMSESELSGCLSRCCGMTMNGQNGMKMNGQTGKGMSNGMRSMNGSTGAIMQPAAAGSCCSGR